MDKQNPVVSDEDYLAKHDIQRLFKVSLKHFVSKILNVVQGVV